MSFSNPFLESSKDTKDDLYSYFWDRASGVKMGEEEKALWDKKKARLQAKIKVSLAKVRMRDRVKKRRRGKRKKKAPDETGEVEDSTFTFGQFEFPLSFSKFLKEEGSLRPPSPLPPPLTLEDLFKACKKADTDKTLEYLQKNGPEFDKMDEAGRTAFNYAFENIRPGTRSTKRFYFQKTLFSPFLELSVQGEKMNGDDLRLALAYALYQRREERVGMILEAKNYPSEAKGEALALCITARVPYSVALAEALPFSKADLYVPPLGTPFMRACEDGIPSLAKYFLAKGPVVLQRANEAGDTPLISALDKEYSELSWDIINTGRPYAPDKVSKTGRTALTAAINVGFVDLALFLMAEAPQVIDQIDWRENTALIYACKKGLELVAIELLKYEESMPDYRDLEGKSALDYARLKGLVGVIAFYQDQELRIHSLYPNEICPICAEEFTEIEGEAMSCGHLIHPLCFAILRTSGNYRCPFCKFLTKPKLLKLFWDTECCICMEPLVEALRVLCCGHILHKECWATMAKAELMFCPYCQKELKSFEA
jgi:ankyrin repeat protein